MGIRRPGSLREFFETFQGSKEISFVVVMHLLRDHKVSWIKFSPVTLSMEVRRIRNNEVVEPGLIYVMRKMQKVFIRNGSLMLKPRESDEILK